MASQGVLVILLAGLTAAAQAQTPVTLAAPGAPPDVMATFIGPQYVGSVNAGGSFAFQGVASASQASTGAYLSHTCNADGSFDAVWSVATYTPTGALATQTPYCEHGTVTGSTYMSLFQAGTGCPLTAPYTGATNRTVTESPGSNVGMLSTSPFCNPNISPAVMHTTANSPAPAPGPTVQQVGAGTIAVDNSGSGTSGSGTGSAGGATPSGNKK